MADELTKALLLEDAVSPNAIAEALFASVTGRVPLVQALVESGAVTPDLLARHLSRGDVPFLRHVVALPELVDRLPAGLCARLLAVPVRRDAITGTIDVAVADPSDPHPAAEIGFHLDAPVRVVRAPFAAIDEAIRRVRMQSLAPPAPSRRLSRPPAPAFFPEQDRLYDSRPQAGAPASVPPRRHTLPPPIERAPVSVPPASPPVVPPAARRKTPPWGTPVHTGPPPRHDSDGPRSGLGSEIPIPLTRKTFAVERGGTQRPPPIAKESQLGEGIPVDVSAYRSVVEVRSRPRMEAARPVGSFIPGPPPMPKTDTGPYAAYAPRPEEHAVRADIGGILAALRIAQSRDDILELVLTGARTLARKVGLFVVKRGGYLGWSCTPELGDRSALQGVLVPLESQSVFDIAVQEGLYLGPIRNDDVHASLLHVMRGASRDVAVVPVRVVGKTAVVILADELGDTMIGTRRLEEIARAAGDAFARIVKNRR